MARAEVNKEYVSFVKGLITEASELTFPPEATIDEDNFVLNRDGSRQRRLGFDKEESFSLIDSGITLSTTFQRTITSHEWKNVGENADLAITVIQFGATLYFFDASIVPVSGSYLGSIALTRKSGGTAGSNPIDTTSGNGVLVVTGADFEPQYIEYDSATGFSKTLITIEIRDFFGVEDNLDIDERPTTLSDAHKYNLFNQGWDLNRINDFYTQRGNVYPSNADVQAYGYYIDTKRFKVSQSFSRKPISRKSSPSERQKARDERR